MRVSITMVAREAGVTPAVVSRVLNGDATLRVRDETRARVLAAAERLDYTPNQAARSLRRSRANALGLAVHDMSNPLYGEIVQGAQRAASEAGFALLLADVSSLARGDAAARASIRGGAIDGLLLQRAGVPADRVILQTASKHVPVVLVNDRSRTLASVAFDDVRGSYVATRHLVDLGHRSIGYLNIGRTGRASGRVQGWRTALREAGLTPGPVVDALHTIESGERGMAELAAGAELPTGLVVGNVLTAIGAMTAARSLGIRVPEDLSVVAYHHVEFAAHVTPTLTTVRMPMAEVGARSVQLLLDQLEGGEPRQVVVDDPPPELMVRGSTAPPRR